MRATRRRSAAIAIPVSVLVGAVLTGCGGPGPDYRGVCRDATTGRRVEDTRCRDGEGGAHWVYYPRGSRVEPVGAPMAGNRTTVPDGASVARGGAPAEGGVVSRGGFGGRGGKGVGG